MKSTYVGTYLPPQLEFFTFPQAHLRPQKDHDKKYPVNADGKSDVDDDDDNRFKN